MYGWDVDSQNAEQIVQFVKNNSPKKVSSFIPILNHFQVFGDIVNCHYRRSADSCGESII